MLVPAIGAYAVIHRRVETVGRQRKRRPIRVGEDLALTRAAGGREVGHARQRLHVGAGGSDAAQLAAIGAIYEPHVVIEHGEFLGGACGRSDQPQAPHVQWCREGALDADADERRAWILVTRELERQQLGLKARGCIG